MMLNPKSKKGPPHEFVLEALSTLSPETRPMFGCLAVYVEGKIVLILRHKGGVDDGVWLATTPAHHASLLEDFPNMRSIEVLGGKMTGWQVLPMDSTDFEAAALRACEFIAQRDPRIGKIPKPRARRKSSSRSRV